MTTNTTELRNDENQWHFVRTEDYRDDAQFTEWDVTRATWRIETQIAALTRFQYRNNPQMREIRHVPALSINGRDVMCWIEYVSEYDEIETVETLGFAYIPRYVDNASIERVFLDSFGEGWYDE